MKRSGRDNFTKPVQETLAKRVGFVCSNPACNVQTLGPNSASNSSSSLGVAAHICAASRGGPRFDPNQAPAQRTSAENGLWVCHTCSRLIDNDEKTYTVEVLHEWKARATEAATRRHGMRVISNADVEDRMAATFKALPSEQSRFAVTNVHKAVQVYYENLDPRLQVQTAYGPRGTSFTIKAKEAVGIQLNWKFEAADEQIKSFQTSLESGLPSVLHIAELTVAGSPALEQLMNFRGPAVLHLLPTGAQVTLRLKVQMPDERFKEIAIGQGTITWGTKSYSIAAELLNGLLGFTITAPITPCENTQGVLNLNVDYSSWTGVDVRLLPYFYLMQELFHVLQGNGLMYVEIFDKMGNHVNETLDSARQLNFVSAHTAWLEYVSMARLVAERYNLSIPLKAKHAATAHECQKLREVIEILQGRGRRSPGIAEAARITMIAENIMEVTDEGAELFADFIIEDVLTCQVFDSEFDMPPLVISLKTVGYVERPQTFQKGDEIQLSFNLNDRAEYSLNFKEPDSQIRLRSRSV